MDGELRLVRQMASSYPSAESALVALNGLRSGLIAPRARDAAR